MDRIEVTDLYKAFYRIMALIWDEPDFRAQGPRETPSFADAWYNLEAYLHENLFLAGCARRVMKNTGQELSSKQVQERLEVCDLTGSRRPGNAGIYYGSGFDWGKPDSDTVPSLIIAADMVGNSIEDTRLFIKIGKSSFPGQ